MPTNALIYLLAVVPEDFRLEAAIHAQGNFERLLLPLGGNLPAYSIPSILVGTKQRDQASVDYNPCVTEPCSVRRVRTSGAVKEGGSETETEPIMMNENINKNHLVMPADRKFTTTWWQNHRGKRGLLFFEVKQIVGDQEVN